MDKTFFRLERSPATPAGRKAVILRVVWAAVERTLFRLPLPRWLRLRRRLLRLFGASFDGHCSSRIRVWYPWKLRMGRLSMAGDRVTFYNLAPITIGDSTVLSQDAYLCAGTHDHLDPTFPLVADHRAAIRIGNGVWVAAGAFVGPGVTIGDNAVVAARSVVVKDVPAGAIVGGNPTRIIGHRPAG
ncbi:LbetaH domain-containing protein [Phycisphaera mikurensis]|uniref:Putative acetyltransferase n=1 Tax=Phycisphaera mikurensis (strain NBRC 102666 / KCTC 22515 / FYK2301M01) TaxID=1142394 RepID=I0IAE4_PHYMF|nr:acetyltransferase [Phycisphaera mikurensis]MBB6441772.1 putative colanic acid biosynthesis acetyltransferase WcaF [Phycisphaera mikurensis]BAM02232.1 putative acetyltransferase [Phycisphaera mikurensis NBRC 102666]